jgi:hypothetical protein
VPPRLGEEGAVTLDLSRLRALCEAEYRHETTHDCAQCHVPMTITCEMEPSAVCNPCAQELVAEAVPALIAEVERLTAERDRLAERVATWEQTVEGMRKATAPAIALLEKLLDSDASAAALERHRKACEDCCTECLCRDGHELDCEAGEKLTAYLEACEDTCRAARNPAGGK